MTSEMDQADASAPALSEKFNQADEQEVDVHERGQITWLSSEDDGPPDCGVTLGLGNGYVLQIGEISKELWERHGGNDMELGNDYGNWIVLFGPTASQTRLIGRAAAGIDADDVLTFIRSLIVPARAFEGNEYRQTELATIARPLLSAYKAGLERKE